jgi:hypothetical protein
MTLQQLRRFRTALKCLFDQATGEPSPVASNVLLLSCDSRPGAVPLPPVTNAANCYELLLHHLSALATPTVAPPGTSSQPLGPAGAFQSP